MAKYYVPFTYEKGGKIEVEAASPKEGLRCTCRVHRRFCNDRLRRNCL